MAQSAKATLKSSTNLTTAKRGDNKPALMDEKIIDQFVKTAFADAEQSVQKGAASIQRLALATLAIIEIWETKGHPNDHDVTDMLVSSLTDSDDRNTLLGYLRASFIPDLDKTLEDDDKAEATTQRNAKNTLLNRALKLAGILRKNGVTRDAFNVQKSNWNVPKHMLLPKGGKWAGSLLDQTTPVLLDGRSYNASVPKREGKGDTYVRVTASYASIVKSAFPPKPRDAADSGQGKPQIDFSKVTHDNNPGSLVWALEELHAILCPDGGDYNFDATGTFTSDQWGKLADIAQANDAMQNRKGFDKTALDAAKARKVG